MALEETISRVESLLEELRAEIALGNDVVRTIRDERKRLERARARQKKE